MAGFVHVVMSFHMPHLLADVVVGCTLDAGGRCSQTA